MRKWWLRLNAAGHEIADPKPAAMPVGYRRPETLAEQVRRLVRTEYSRMAVEEGFESFDEADDFDIDEDFDVSTPYETDFDPVLEREVAPADFRRDGFKEEYVKRASEHPDVLAEAEREVAKRSPKRSRKDRGEGTGATGDSVQMDLEEALHSTPT